MYAASYHLYNEQSPFARSCRQISNFLNNLLTPKKICLTYSTNFGYKKKAIIMDENLKVSNCRLRTSGYFVLLNFPIFKIKYNSIILPPHTPLLSYIYIYICIYISQFRMKYLIKSTNAYNINRFQFSLVFFQVPENSLLFPLQCSNFGTEEIY